MARAYPRFSEIRHSVRCCSAVSVPGWQRHPGCAVWAESDGTRMGGCHVYRSFFQAAAICAAAGGEMTRDQPR